VPPAKTKKRPQGSERELFLIDGNSLAYRAFFALPEDMATSDGRPTNAIYGFASMLAKIITDHNPAQVVVAWDAGMSGREVTYKEYKAQRKSRPDLLREQWPHLAPLAEAFGFTNIKAEGFEADDLIATLVRRASDAKIPVMVVSGDRDVYQLVGDGVRVMTTSRGITDTKIYDRDGVIERYGIPPELVPDLIGLKGDTSDNIPGVPGIGDKTAADLLQRFGSLETVLDSVDEISGAKRKENLTNHADDARVSKELATAQYDVECDLDLKEVMARPQDRTRLRELASEFELRAVIERLEDELDEVIPGRAVAEELEIAAEEGDVSDLGQGETSIAVGGGRWAATDGERLLAGDAHDLGALAAELRGRPLIAHDFKSLGGGPGEGLLAAAADGEALDLAFDTMVAAYLLDPARRTYELAELAADAGLAAAPSTAEEGQMSLEAEEGDAAGDPAVDARLAFELAARQRPRLEEAGLVKLMNEVEMPLIEVLAAMERIGIRVDAQRLADISAGLGDRIQTLQAQIFDLAGHEFTIGSPQQLGEVFFNELGLTKKRRGKTGFSTDARVLAQIRDEHEIVPKVESWRELTKLKNTYLDSLPALIAEDGRIHTTFNQVATTTGRLSSTNPNLQNIPIRSEEGRPIRSCFVAEEGMVLVSCDYNQVELRVLAHAAEEDVLRGVFASGEDVHATTAAGIVGADPDAISPGERSKAKMVNYGIAYGLSDFGLADRLQIDRDEARQYIDRYFERYPAIKRFIDATIERAREDGYVTTLMGRRRRIPELRSSNRQRYLQGERLAISTVIQGTAADIIKVAMVRCRAALADAGLDSRLVLQIHDELLFEGPPGEAEAVEEIARREMVGAFELDPPLEVDVGSGPDWLAAK
jgi:DNA polymerase-1